MTRRKLTHGRFLSKLHDSDVILAEGPTITEIAKCLEGSELTCHHRRNTYDGTRNPETERLKELENESAQLKRKVARQALKY